MNQKKRLYACAFLTGGFLLVSVTVLAAQQKRTGKQQQLDLQLLQAVQAGQVMRVQFLLNRGASPRKRTSIGYIPLQEADRVLKNTYLKALSSPSSAPPSKEEWQRLRHIEEEVRRRLDIYKRLQQAKQ